jgi:hypothetical protein
LASTNLLVCWLIFKSNLNLGLGCGLPIVIYFELLPYLSFSLSHTKVSLVFGIKGFRGFPQFDGVAVYQLRKYIRLASVIENISVDD